MKTTKDFPSPTTGVPHAIAEDMAASGDTRNRLHHESLPKRKIDGSYGEATPVPQVKPYLHQFDYNNPAPGPEDQEYGS